MKQAGLQDAESWQLSVRPHKEAAVQRVRVSAVRYLGFKVQGFTFQIVSFEVQVSSLQALRSNLNLGFRRIWHFRQDLTVDGRNCAPHMVLKILPQSRGRRVGRAR